MMDLACRRGSVATSLLAVFVVVAATAAGMGITYARWATFHAAAFEKATARLERQRAEHAKQLSQFEGKMEIAVAAAKSTAKKTHQGNDTIVNKLAATVAARDKVVASLKEENHRLATLTKERDDLAARAAASATDPSTVVDAERQKNPAGGLPPEITNSIGMKFVEIPAGTFSMGSANGDSDEGPVHEVTITKPFYLGVYEVTNGDGKAVKGFVPSKWKDDSLPIESVTWDEAVAFCAALSALPAERQSGRVYRLPTEAEWEYACRAGTTTAYSFGDKESLLNDFAWFDDNSGSQTHPVGQKRPNGWGLYDMHGNVYEWCSDWHGDYAAGAVRDAAGPATGSVRVLRGGGWDFTAGDCRSASRDWSPPSFRYSVSGFRLALSPSGAGSPEAGE